MVITSEGRAPAELPQGRAVGSGRLAGARSRCDRCPPGSVRTRGRPRTGQGISSSPRRRCASREAVDVPLVEVPRVIRDRHEVQGSWAAGVAVRVIEGPVIEGKAEDESVRRCRSPPKSAKACSTTVVGRSRTTSRGSARRRGRRGDQTGTSARETGSSSRTGAPPARFLGLGVAPAVAAPDRVLHQSPLAIGLESNRLIAVPLTLIEPDGIDQPRPVSRRRSTEKPYSTWKRVLPLWRAGPDTWRYASQSPPRWSTPISGARRRRRSGGHRPAFRRRGRVERGHGNAALHLGDAPVLQHLGEMTRPPGVEQPVIRDVDPERVNRRSPPQ